MLGVGRKEIRSWMRLRKISYILSFALVLSSVSGVAYASSVSDIDARGIIGDSVIIDKEEGTGGGSGLLPDEVLGSVSKPDGGSVETKPVGGSPVVDGDGNIGTWGDGVSSSSTPLYEKKGNLKISLPDIGEKVDRSGVEFSLSKVADIVNGEFVMLESYEDSGIDLNDLENANDLEIAANVLKKVAVTEQTLVTNAFGVCKAKDLDIGVYLVYASNIAGYDDITPFLVSVPVWDEAEKVMSFDVEVIPKHTPVCVKKPEGCTAPATGYSGGGIFGILSACSLLGGGSLLGVFRKVRL